MNTAKQRRLERKAEKLRNEAEEIRLKALAESPAVQAARERVVKAMRALDKAREAARVAEVKVRGNCPEAEALNARAEQMMADARLEQPSRELAEFIRACWTGVNWGRGFEVVWEAAGHAIIRRPGYSTSGARWSGSDYRPPDYWLVDLRKWDRKCAGITAMEQATVRSSVRTAAGGSQIAEWIELARNPDSAKEDPGHEMPDDVQPLRR